MENDNTDTNSDLDADAPVEVTTPRVPTEYEIRLRKEAKTSRLKALEAETTAAAAITQAKAEADLRVADAAAKAEAKIVRAELKAHALKAGLADMDFLKLIDTSSLKLSDDGELEGAAELLEKYRETKPHWFGTASTSSGAKLPEPKPQSQKSAKDMTPDELKMLERQLGLRR